MSHSSAYSKLYGTFIRHPAGLGERYRTPVGVVGRGERRLGRRRVGGVTGSIFDSGRFQELYVVHDWFPFASMYRVWFPAASYPNDVVMPDAAATGCVSWVTSPAAPAPGHVLFPVTDQGTVIASARTARASRRARRDVQPVRGQLVNRPLSHKWE